MEWQQLEYFRVVAQVQHFTRAAERLAISQPALSRSIANLEAELGVPLFERKGRTVKLNRFGESFLRHVVKALREIEEGKRELADALHPEHGMVILAFLPTLGTHLVPQLLREFQQEHPRTKFKLFQHGSSVILHKLEDGDVDICLSLAPPADNRDIEWRHLLSEELFVIVPSGHRLASRDSVRLAELAGESFVLLKHGHGLRSVVESLCKQAGFDPDVTFEGDEVTTVVGLVAAGLGISVIPHVPSLALMNVCWLHISEPRSERKIGIAWKRNRYLPPPAQQFKMFVERRFERGSEGPSNLR
jgi:DNA-binding transcriptional LysR family regulator